MLYLSRIPAILQHTVLAARAIVSLETPEDSRAKVLAYIGVSYGVGFAVGPAFGGLLSDRFGLSFVPLVSTVGSVTSLVWCWWMLENPTPHTRKDTQIEEDSVELRPLMAPEFTDEFESESVPPAVLQEPEPPVRSVSGKGALENLWRVSKLPHIRSLMMLKIVAGLGTAIFHAAFGLAAVEFFHLSPAGTGYLMSYVGCLTLVFQATIVGVLEKRFRDSTLIKGSTLGLAIA